MRFIYHQSRMIVTQFISNRVERFYFDQSVVAVVNFFASYSNNLYSQVSLLSSLGYISPIEYDQSVS